jgi:hypothetical protein
VGNIRDQLKKIKRKGPNMQLNQSIKYKAQIA